MIGIMGRAIKLDDSYVEKEIELFSRLTTENQVQELKLNSARSLLTLLYYIL